ncbi:MAG TPA: tlde1 domain-containing protein [Solirubrobacteraceae bacterium]|nr:tlde1 domain-containing protein [Solirubrobacteraceae bacterium]
MITFAIGAGELRDDEGELIGSAYSGAPGHVNVAADCALPQLGPIPPGRYLLGEPYDDPERGPFCIPLTPCTGTDTFRRGGFLIHADNPRKPPRSSSEGCIVPRDRPTRIAAWVAAQPDRLLEVVP